jgi:hypothetical protein
MSQSRSRSRRRFRKGTGRKWKSSRRFMPNVIIVIETKVGLRGR